MAEMARRKHRTIARALWGFAALSGIAVAFVYKILKPRYSQDPDEPRFSATHPVEHAQRKNPTTDFEPTDWSLRPVALIYAGIPVLLVVSCFVLIVAYPNALPDVDRTLRISPPGPRLQTDPAGDLQKFRAEEERRLNTYYWIDRDKGIVHIPIEQAMKTLVATGAPGFPKGQP